MKIKLKRGLSSNITAVNLDNGEPAFCTDTGKFYIGDGTSNILINPDGGTADTAAKLAVAREIALSGDATGAVNFDGSGNVNIAVTIADDSHNHTVANVDGLQTSLNAKADTSSLGTAATKNTGTASGNIPELDANGKLNTSVLPALAITDTFVVANESAMLGLTAQVGDIAIRTDLSKTFILQTSPASTLANWKELATPADVVTSVAGKTGVVTLTKSDVGLGNVANESKATMFSSPSFTGTPTAPTPSKGVNTTQLATTAYVMTALADYVKKTDTIDGGTF